MDPCHDPLLAEQIAYYDARAPEYDRMVAGVEGYGWDTGDIAPVLEADVRATVAGRDVLEVACGTGAWTGRLAASAATVTALDASPAMLSIHRDRVPAANVRRIQADVFGWQPDRRYDVVFFAFWLSHVPPGRLAAFWTTVGGALRRDGAIVVVDEAWTQAATGHERASGDSRGTAIRRLEDGREFRMVKVYYTPETLTDALAELGWTARVRTLGERFYAATARRAAPPT